MNLALQLLVADKFDRAMRHCDNLILVHRRAGAGSRGRPQAETSVNRAVVVIAIASWQAVVEDMATFVLDRYLPDLPNPAFGMVTEAIRKNAEKGVERFSTPNAENTRKLLQSVGFDPRPYWTWSNGARGTRQVTLKPPDVETKLRKWLKVRHAIAHGDERLPEVDVLQAVRQNVISISAGPTLRLDDAKQCVAFVRKLADVTIAGLEAELPPRPPTP